MKTDSELQKDLIFNILIWDLPKALLKVAKPILIENNCFQGIGWHSKRKISSNEKLTYMPLNNVSQYSESFTSVKTTELKLLVVNSIYPM